MKRKALFVGVNEYADNQIRDLRCSVRDAHSMNDLFEEIGYETRCLENPGKGNVVQAVSEMTAGLKAGDQFLFYFAGHGFTDSGQHLLFCSDDRHELLRFHRAGIPFDLLELETRTGGFDRAFLLDACQSDFLTGTRGGDASTRDLIAICDMVPSAEDAPGSFYVLRSCSKYEHALEIESRNHGLFTLAMMNVLRQSRRSGTELLFNDALREMVREKMFSIARDAGMTANQTPESDGRGTLQVLISGRKVPVEQVPPQPPPPQYRQPSVAPSLVVCPVCGKKNDPRETFRCRECGRDNLCLDHRDGTTFLCDKCAEKVLLESQKIAQEMYDKGEACYYGLNGVKKDSVEAVKWYRKAAEQGYADAQLRLGDCYRLGKGVPGDLGEAEKWYLKALKLYREAAERGSAEAQCSLGSMYASGKGVSQDDAEAMRWYHKAAEQGYAKAQFSIGECYENGECVSEDVDEAVKWYHKAAAQGYLDAQYRLASCYENGEGVQQDYAEAAKWYRQAADKDDTGESQWSLARLYEEGKGVERSYKRAAKWYQEAAEAGDKTAQYKLGNYFQDGQGVQLDYEKALTWYLKAAVPEKRQYVEIINEEAREALRQLLSEMYESEDDADTAEKWYSHVVDEGNKDEIEIVEEVKAAIEEREQERDGDEESAPSSNGRVKVVVNVVSSPNQTSGQNSPQNLYEQAENYYHGQNGVKENRAKAFELYQRAAEQGHAEAQYSLGYMYAYGEGAAKDEEKALFWYRKAAAQGHQKAARFVEGLKERMKKEEEAERSRLYWERQERERKERERRELDDNSRKAQARQEAAAREQRDTEEKMEKALRSYEEGNYSVAALLWRICAVRGVAAAQHNLGALYATGKGVEQDYAQAIEWLQKSAAQGDEDSQKLLTTIKLRLQQERQRLQNEKERLQSEKERLLNEQRRLEQQNASELEERRRLLQEQGTLLNSLGVRFYTGTQGQVQDYAKAAEHFREAAEMGNVNAQFNLGVCYASGTGVAKNISEAVRWYRRAAENGHDKAKEELRKLGYAVR